MFYFNNIPSETYFTISCGKIIFLFLGCVMTNEWVTCPQGMPLARQE